MANHQWDLKSNYILACTVCKYGSNLNCWNLVAEDLAGHIKTTPEDCKSQFDFLSQQYGQDLQNQSVETLANYIFSAIKRLYYGDLCERMAESRESVMVMYDFIRLFRGGRITLNDITAILQDMKNTVPTGDNTQDDEREKKIKMLARLKSHVTQQIMQTSNMPPPSFPIELLPPPPPFFQQQPIITNDVSQEQPIVPSMENDRQVPSINGYSKSNPTERSSFPVIIQSNNLHVDNERLSSNNNHHQSNEEDIEEIELSSDEESTNQIETPNIDEPIMNSNLINDQDESTFISDEQTESNESSNTPPIPAEISNSNERDLYDNASSASVSNPSTYDTRLSNDEQVTSSLNGHGVSSNLQLNTSIHGSNDCVTLDSDQLPSTQNHYTNESESNVTTPRRIPIVDDEVARMDAEQIPEPIPADITDVAVPNDNAVFVPDELVSSTAIPKIPSITTTIIDQENTNSEDNGSMITKSSHHQSHSASINFRKSVNSILNNLKNAKYGPDFSKPLKAFKLPDDYYHRVKKPLDIPEIRDRMNNGDYDENILLFERDVLLMFTNALSMYHRDLDIHGHAQFMINYAMELFIPIQEAVIPWKNVQEKNNGNYVFPNYAEENNGDNISNTPSPSVTSTSSSIRIESAAKSLRRPAMFNHPMPKRQRKTIQ